MSSFIEKYRTKVLEIFRLCKQIGVDDQGNRYYEKRSKKGDTIRWILYAKGLDPTVIPTAWLSWLQHTFNDPPQNTNIQSWQKPRKPNLSGTNLAHKPAPLNTQSFYQPWTP
jgi:NADH:ubiquinone oxidoreductase subunit